VIKVIKELAD